MAGVSRKLTSGCLIRALSQQDFNRAAALIPSDVMPNSGDEDGWVWGIREARLYPSADRPRDPGLGGGVYSSAVKAFAAARNQAELARKL